jgi:hypothetical protein
MMRNFFSLISIVLLSAVAVAAQAAKDLKSDSGREKVEYSSHLKGYKVGRGHEGKTGADARTKAKVRGAARVRAPHVLRVGPSTTYLRHGLSTDEVVRFLGEPVSVSERQEGDAHLATYIFPRGAGRVLVAEFKNGSLISSRAELTTATAQDQEAR